ncbi:hypothetical protein IPA_08595 [Ignicoccus pacificus DSM 13166]|uniref:Metallo-beta-lactamase domain-containing protein n=1 Tax=Ignicoccus pacificus DSM 13166 TaxID=940294 RepID=A0A977KBZ3_9CREN|nr:hypothetical protein IPA_08595 [Ignicoccus pacificus DSM 13166]
MALEKVTMTVLIDNTSHPPFKKAWGLSILIESPEVKILWDSGPDPNTLTHNANILNKDLKVDYLIFSHRHWDHTGGTEAVRYRKAIAPRDWLFPKFKNLVMNNKYLKLIDEVIVTRPLMGMGLPEQALLIDVKGYGTVMLVGCSHPGVADMYEDVVKNLGIRPRMVIGGFHLFGAPKRLVEETIARLRNLGAEKLHPIHCSGEYAKLLARSDVETGTVIELP